MQNTFQELWTQLGQYLERQLGSDSELRTQIRLFAQLMLEMTAEPEKATPGSSADLMAEPSASLGVVPPPPAEPLPPLTLGQSTLRHSIWETDYRGYSQRKAKLEKLEDSLDADLRLIAERCRLKAEGCRWAATRRRLMQQGADFRKEIEPKDTAIIARARAVPGCFLWMCHPEGPEPEDLSLFELTAHCFDVLADMLVLMDEIRRKFDSSAPEFAQGLDLLAEAQSAVRAAVLRLRDRERFTDSDQQYVFNWIKATAAAEQIFIRRYMRVDDPADPTRWMDLQTRIEELEKQVEESYLRDKQRRKLLGKLRHKCSTFASCQAEERDALGQEIIRIVNDLVAGGLPPSSLLIREPLLPIIDSLPQAFPDAPHYPLVVREIDRYLAQSGPTNLPEIEQEPSPAVQRVAELLEGRAVVLIGGDRRPASEQALVHAFRLSELLWIATPEHSSVTRFEPYVARPDVAVVLLAIRWSSHSYSEVIEYCNRYGKPLVRLPGGYNPNQVAVQILEQCSDRLERSREFSQMT